MLPSKSFTGEAHSLPVAAAGLMDMLTSPSDGTMAVLLAIGSLLLALNAAITFLLIRALLRRYGAVTRGLQEQERIRRAEQALEASEVKRASIIDSAMDAIISVDSSQRVVVFNAAAERMFRCSAREALGQPLDRFIPESARGAHRSHMAAFAQNGGTTRTMGHLGHLLACRATGEHFPIEATISQVAVSGEKILTAIVRDMTKREQLERCQRLLSDAGQVLTESLEIGTILERVGSLATTGFADACLLVLMGPDSAPHRFQVTGRCSDEGREIEAALRCLSVARAMPDELDQVLETGETALWVDPAARFRGAVKLRGAPEDPLAALDPGVCLCAPLIARHRRLGALLLFNRGHQYGEVERKTAEELARMVALVVDNARLYGEVQSAIEFIGVASHELRGPLTSLHLLGHMLLAQVHRDGGIVNPDRLASCVRMVLTQLEGQISLLNTLLDVARMTSGRMELKLEPVDFVTLVREIVARQQPVLEKAGSPATLHADGCIQGAWDRVRLEQVVTNLLTNAAKYGKGNPIEVEVEADDEVARLVVRDRGVGIAPEYQARIFERFERGAPPSNAPGFGVGLWVVRQIVEAHEGTISVDSQPGEGATFVVALPRSTPRLRAVSAFQMNSVASGPEYPHAV